MSQNGSFSWTPPGSNGGAGGMTFNNSGGSGGGLFDMSQPSGLGSMGSSLGSPVQGSPQRSIGGSPYGPPYQNVSNLSSPDRGPRRISRPIYGPQNQTFNANPNQTFNANPNQTFNANPNQTFNANPNQTFNANPNQTFNANPNQTFNANLNQTFNGNPNQSFANAEMFNRTGPGYNQTGPAIPYPRSPVMRNALSFNDEPGSIHPDWQYEWDEQWKELNVRREAERSVLMDLGLNVGNGGGGNTSGGNGGNGGNLIDISGRGGSAGSGPAAPSGYEPNQALNSFRVSPTPARAPPRTPENSGNLMDFSLRTQGDSPLELRSFDYSLGGNIPLAPYDYDGLKHNVSDGGRPRDDFFMNVINEAVEMRARDLKRIEMNRGLNNTMLPSMPGPGGYAPLDGNDPRNNMSLGAPPMNRNVVDMNPNQLQMMNLPENPMVYPYAKNKSFSGRPTDNQPGSNRRGSVGDTPLGSDLIELERSMVAAALVELRTKNPKVIPDPNAGKRAKSPKRTSASPKRKSKEGETVPDDVMMNLHKLIVGRLTNLKKDLMEKGVEETVAAHIGPVLNELLPEVVCATATTESTLFLIPKIEEKIKPLVLNACLDYYGPGLVPVIPQLISGSYICSKPCKCGEDLKCEAKSGGQCQGPVPSLCCDDQPPGCRPKGGACQPQTNVCPHAYACQPREGGGGGCNDACTKFKQQFQGCQKPHSCAPETSKVSRGCGPSRIEDVPFDEGSDRGRLYPDLNDRSFDRSVRGQSFPSDCISSCPCKRSQSRGRGR